MASLVIGLARLRCPWNKGAMPSSGGENGKKKEGRSGQRSCCHWTKRWVSSPMLDQIDGLTDGTDQIIIGSLKSSFEEDEIVV